MSAESGVSAGEVLLRERCAYAVLRDSHFGRNNCCSVCLSYNTTVHLCESCGMPVCAACSCDPQSSTIHARECSAIARVRAAANDGQDTTKVRSLIRMIAQGGESIQMPDDVLALQENFEVETEDVKASLCAAAKDALDAMGMSCTDAAQSQLALLAARIHCNEIAVSRPWAWNQGQSCSMAVLGLGEDTYGVGMWPTLSFCNHSCSPNAHVSFVGSSDRAIGSPEIELRALKPLRDGEPITISYIPLYAPAMERRAQLHRSYHFECACERCASSGILDDCDDNDDDDDDDVFMDSMLEVDMQMHGMLCQSCEGGLMERQGAAPSSMSDSMDWTCDACGRVSSIKLHYDACSHIARTHEQIVQKVKCGDARGAFSALLELTGGVAGTDRFEHLLHPLHVLLHATRIMLIGFAHILGEHGAVKQLAAREGDMLRAASFCGEFDLWAAIIEVLRKHHGGKSGRENPSATLIRYYGEDVLGVVGLARPSPSKGRRGKGGKRKKKHHRR